MLMSDAEIRDLLPDNTLIRLIPIGREIQAVRIDTGEDITHMIPRHTRTKAVAKNHGLRVKYTATGRVQFRSIESRVVESEATLRGTNGPSVATANATVASVAPTNDTPVDSDYTPLSDEDIKKFIANAMSYKPDSLYMSAVRWKYMCHSALRGENIMMVGPSGCGKTLACQTLPKVFPNRPFFYFNLGASQDPRGMLIGNTHFSKTDGTFFAKSLFVQAIQTPGAIILLDELSRAHDDASNILMTVLDPNQRYLRIDEAPDTPTIPVAAGVTFEATANVGNEYTGTRVMDRALLDRFIIIEMDALSEENERELLEKRYPNLNTRWTKAIADVAAMTRREVQTDDPKVSTIVSTRQSLKIAELISDGFNFAEAAEVCVFPFFDAAGGADSERNYMIQYCQKHMPTDLDDKDSPFADTTATADEDNKVPWY